MSDQPSVAFIAEFFPVDFRLFDQRDATIWSARVELPGEEVRLLVPTRKDLHLRVWDSTGSLVIHDRVDARPQDWSVTRLANPFERRRSE